MKQKIKEFVESGAVKGYDFIGREDDKSKVVAKLTEVWGIGPKNASQLYD